MTDVFRRSNAQAGDTVVPPPYSYYRESARMSTLLDDNNSPPRASSGGDGLRHQMEERRWAGKPDLDAYKSDKGLKKKYSTYERPPQSDLGLRSEMIAMSQKNTALIHDLDATRVEKKILEQEVGRMSLERNRFESHTNWADGLGRTPSTKPSEGPPWGERSAASLRSDPRDKDFGWNTKPRTDDEWSPPPPVHTRRAWDPRPDRGGEAVGVERRSHLDRMPFGGNAYGDMTGRDDGRTTNEKIIQPSIEVLLRERDELRHRLQRETNSRECAEIRCHALEEQRIPEDLRRKRLEVEVESMNGLLREMRNTVDSFEESLRKEQKQKTDIQVEKNQIASELGIAERAKQNYLDESQRLQAALTEERKENVRYAEEQAQRRENRAREEAKKEIEMLQAKVEIQKQTQERMMLEADDLKLKIGEMEMAAMRMTERESGLMEMINDLELKVKKLEDVNGISRAIDCITINHGNAVSQIDYAKKESRDLLRKNQSLNKDLKFFKKTNAQMRKSSEDERGRKAVLSSRSSMPLLQASPIPTTTDPRITEGLYSKSLKARSRSASIPPHIAQNLELKSWKGKALVAIHDLQNEMSTLRKSFDTEKTYSRELEEKLSVLGKISQDTVSQMRLMEEESEGKVKNKWKSSPKKRSPRT